MFKKNKINGILIIIRFNFVLKNCNHKSSSFYKELHLFIVLTSVYFNTEHIYANIN